MIIRIKNQKVYFDANFLIYLSISKKPSLKKQARILFGKLLSNKNKLFLSPLSFDEAWWGIKNEYNIQNSTTLSCCDVPIYSELEQFTTDILPKAELAQFLDAKKGTKRALEFLSRFRLRPRDAFHLAMMIDNKIFILISDDGDFIRNVKGQKIDGKRVNVISLSV